MKHLILFLCLACIFCLPVLALDKPGADASSSSDQASDEIKVETKYDKAKDETTVEFRQMEIAHSAEQQVFLSVSSTYKGQKPKKQPDDIVVIVSVVSARGYRYPDMMAMQVAADGKKLPQVLMLNLDKRQLGEDYLETIGTRMKYEVFKHLTESKNVVLQLQNLTLQLDEAQITKLRELEALLH